MGNRPARSSAPTDPPRPTVTNRLTKIQPNQDAGPNPPQQPPPLPSHAPSHLPHPRSFWHPHEQRKRSVAEMREVKDVPDNMVELVMPLTVVTRQTSYIDSESREIRLLSCTFVASNHCSDDIDSFSKLMAGKLPVIDSSEKNRDGCRVREWTRFKAWVGMGAQLIERVTVIDKDGNPFSSSGKATHTPQPPGLKCKIYWFDQKDSDYAKMEYPVSIISLNATERNGHEIRKNEEITITFQKSEKDHKPAFALKCNEPKTTTSKCGDMKIREEVNCAPYSHLHIKAVLTLSQQPLVGISFDDKRVYVHEKPAVDNLHALLQKNRTRSDAVTTMSLRSPFERRESIRPLSADTSAGSSEPDPRLANGGLSPSIDLRLTDLLEQTPDVSKALPPYCVPPLEQKCDPVSDQFGVTPCCDASMSPVANRQRNAKLSAGPPKREKVQKLPVRSPANRSSTSSTSSSRKPNPSTRTAREAPRREKK